MYSKNLQIIDCLLKSSKKAVKPSSKELVRYAAASATTSNARKHNGVCQGKLCP